MKKKKRASAKDLPAKSRDRFMRRLIKRLLSSVLKRQTVNRKGNVKPLLSKFKDVEEAIETREVARQSKGKRRKRSE